MSHELQGGLVLAASVAGVGSVWKRTNPAVLVIRLLIGLRAAWFFAGELIGGAWSRRYRWRECMDRARREV